MPKVHLLSTSHIPLQDHALLLTEELKNLNYDAHFVVGKHSYPKEDVKVTYTICNELNIKRVKHQDGDVIIWINHKPEQLKKLKLSKAEKEQFAKLKAYADTKIDEGIWVRLNYDNLSKLQLKIQEIVLTKLIYTKSGIIEFATEPPKIKK